MDGSEKINIVRAIVNDAHYWVPTIVIIICGFYMLGRLVFVERQSKQKILPKAGTTEDSVKKDREKATLNVKPKSKEETPKVEDKRKGNFSEKQSGGVVNQNYYDTPQPRTLTSELKREIQEFAERTKGKVIQIGYLTGQAGEPENLAEEIKNFLVKNNYTVGMLCNVMLVGEPVIGILYTDIGATHCYPPPQIPVDLTQYCEIFIGDNPIQ